MEQTGTSGTVDTATAPEVNSGAAVPAGFQHSDAVLGFHREIVADMIAATKELLVRDGDSQMLNTAVIFSAAGHEYCPRDKKTYVKVAAEMRDHPALRQARDMGIRRAYFVPANVQQTIPHGPLPENSPRGWIKLGAEMDEGELPGTYVFRIDNFDWVSDRMEGTLLLQSKTGNEVLLRRLELLQAEPQLFPLELAHRVFNYRESDVLPCDPQERNGLTPEQAQCLNSFEVNPVTVIAGPPGSGKSHVFCSILEECLARNWLTLMTSSTNRAVDSVAEKLVEIAFASCDGIIGKAVAAEQITRYGDATNPKMLKHLAFNNRRMRGQKRGALSMWEAMSKDRVSLCTTFRFLNYLDQIFDVVAVDEVGVMALPYVYCVAAAARRRVIICGDPDQLKPVFPYPRVSTQTRTLFTTEIYERNRIRRHPGESIDPRVNILTVQFRMVDELAELVRMVGLYRRYVTAQPPRPPSPSEEVARHAAPFPGMPFAVVDTSAFHSPRNNGNFNAVHADIAKRLITYYTSLRGIGRIGMMAPYKPQANDFRSWIREQKIGSCTVGTVHAFQGTECPLILLDTVESPPTDGTTARHAFSDELANRGMITRNVLNVAVSRAQAKFIMLINADYISQKLTTGCYLQRVLRLAIDQKRIIPASMLLEQIGMRDRKAELVSYFNEQPFEFNGRDCYAQFREDARQARFHIDIRSREVNPDNAIRIINWMDGLCLKNHISVSFYIPGRTKKIVRESLYQITSSRTYMSLNAAAGWPHGDSFDLIFDGRLGYSGAWSLLDGKVGKKIQRWNLLTLREGK